jgi:putative colanic acid biosynthesis UDP-glucose lipid carrier transferase
MSMGQKSYSYFYRMVFMTSDFFIVNLSFIICYLFYALSSASLLSSGGIKILLLFNLTWLISASVMRLYTVNTFQRIEDIYRQSAKTLLLQCLFFITVILVMGEDENKKMFLFVCYSILTFFIGVSRFLLTYVSEFLIKSKMHRKIAIVGYNETGLELERYFRGNANMYSFEGFFDNGGKHISINGDGKIVGPIEQCIDFAVENDIREIYSTILPEDHDDVNRLIEVADRNCVRIKFVTDVNTRVDDAIRVHYLGDLSVMSLRHEPLQDISNRVKKRIFDIVVSFCVIVFILSWLVPILAILIKIESKGPVFFKQLRSGRDNKPFWCYKFRSMRTDLSLNVQATKSDPRITKMGAFLRKTSLDEFPQFLNVLRGDMSIVGPRPHPLWLTDQYSALINQYMVRQLLKPGVTGWAQVNGYRGETKNIEAMEKRVEFDIWYMERWSTMLDIRIIFMTVINVFRGEEQAY